MSDNEAREGENSLEREPLTQLEPCQMLGSERPDFSEEEVVETQDHKPRWLMGVGKKSEWGKESRKVTLRRGTKQPEWKQEMEKSLHASEEGGRCMPYSDWILEKAIDLMKRTLSSLGEEIPEPYGRPSSWSHKGRDTEGDVEPATPGTFTDPGAPTPYRTTDGNLDGKHYHPQWRHRSIPRRPPLEVKFKGEPTRLGFFLTQVLSYMEEYGQDIPSDKARIRIVQSALDGPAADWVVNLHDSNAPELSNFNRFMSSLRRRFEDPLADRKARERITTMKQGKRPVAEYTQEFRAIASKLNWPEDILLGHFKDGLNYDLYDACLPRGDPHQLEEWYVLAEEAEIDILKRHRRGKQWSRPPPELTHRPVKSSDTAKKQMGCFKCGREGHRAVECRSKAPQHNPDRSPINKPGKYSAKPKETAMRMMEIAETPTSAHQGERTPAYTTGPVDASDDSSEGEPLVSGCITPIFKTVTILIPPMPEAVKVKALIDSGCTRCLISPTLVGNLGIPSRRLEQPISFGQLDGSIAGGVPATLATLPIHLSLGNHEEDLTFVVTPDSLAPH
ncbi:Retrotransposon-derived protein PEG10 [Crotalus adamanteus]|uniref:Retrotransposon-derived protein PEG10 n=1 Tax=Crotalus adamanteus TaxID=8729 RepID=A0AAW1AZW3_CROAD